MASVFGSLHCSVMCGPIFMSISISKIERCLYHFGRLWSYLALGATAGLIGNLAFQRLIHSPVGVAATFALSAYFIFSGLFMFTGKSDITIVPGLHRLIARWTKLAAKMSSSRCRAFVVGLATALLPCGWLYLFVGASIAVAHPLGSALLLFVFWLGTLPVFAVLSRAKYRVARHLKKSGHALSATMLILLGLLVPIVKLTRPVHFVASTMTFNASQLIEFIGFSNADISVDAFCGSKPVPNKKTRK